MASAITKDLLLHTLDVVVEQLSQNEQTAQSTKMLMRRWADKLISLQESQGTLDIDEVAKLKHDVFPNGASGKRARHDTDGDAAMADGGDEALPSKKAKRGEKGKAKRKTSAHNAFVTYCCKCVPQSWQERLQNAVPKNRGTGSLKLVNNFKKQLSSEALQQFTEDIKPILEMVNSDDDRKQGDNSQLVELLKKMDEEAGRKVHPLFKGFKAFIETESKAMQQAAVEASQDADAVGVSADTVLPAGKAAKSKKQKEKKGAKENEVPATAPAEQATVHAAQPKGSKQASKAKQAQVQPQENSSSTDGESESDEEAAAKNNGSAKPAATAAVQPSKQESSEEEESGSDSSDNESD